MMNVYRAAIQTGWSLPPRGDRLNTWADPLNDMTDRLAKEDLSSEVQRLLVEVFEEVGHLLREATSIEGGP